MKKKKTELDFHSDFNWCVDNDFQVYIKPMELTGHCRIAVRKGGISTKGKPSLYCKEKDITIYSKETLGSVLYKNQNKAAEKLPEVLNYLRNLYGKV